MAINRRDLLKITGISAAALAVGGCAADNAASADAPKAFSLANTELMGAPKGKRVVVCGAGFAGLTVAKYLKKASKEIEVVVLEKRDNFMACPYSNGWLGGIQGITLDTLSFDFFSPATKNGYHFIQATITGFDRANRVVKTDMGTIGYDYLVLAPGIAYDYTKLSGGDKLKEERLRMETPAALMPGSEHLALHKQLRNMEEGNFIITVPDGAYRCPPAPYERAAMVAYYMKTNKIKGKVLILDPKDKPGAKPKQFMESYKTLYPDIIEFVGNCSITSVDLDKKEIHCSIGKDTKVAKAIKFEVANIIPKNVCHPLIKMAGVEHNADGYAKVKLPNHAALNDDRVYICGDAVAAVNFDAGSGYPKSGHMANSQGKIVAKQLSAKILGKADTGLLLPDNTCFSFVNGTPKESIVVNHAVAYLPAEGKIKVTAKVGDRSTDLGKATDEWYKGLMNDLFS
jgi:sulfide dehydrogenase [flavocytochrome c] flavoprotein chain